ncbi:hypothetical protein SAMN05446935_7329 [Burkholderia sp. YR290]|nr:hypothetical protein SAMN05446935_7329 [Burkholderia sp. YR290]
MLDMTNPIDFKDKAAVVRACRPVGRGVIHG